MKPVIEFCDNKDAFLLGEAICLAIRDLSEIKRRAAAWGCSKSELNDRIFRLERMLKSLNYEEEGAL